MSTFVVEIIDKFEEPVPCQELVYTPIPGDCEVRSTRVYEITTAASKSSVVEFVESVLVDDVSQEYKFLDSVADGALPEFDQRIDVWLKSNVLDLEEDYLLDYCREHGESTGLEVESIRILDRYYLFLSGSDSEIVSTIVQDLANPVIHDWTVGEHA